MDPLLLIVLAALIYILFVGGLAALRREGFSLRLAVETLILAALLVGISLIIGEAIHPIVCLIIIYLITMRSRLAIDLANVLSRRGYHSQAENLYTFVLKMGADRVSRQIVHLNQAVHSLKQDQPGETVEVLERLLADSQGNIGPKHEAAARFNLAVAYQRVGNDAKAIVEFNKVVDIMPSSVYGYGAKKALERGRGAADKE